MLSSDDRQPYLKQLSSTYLQSKLLYKSMIRNQQLEQSRNDFQKLQQEGLLPPKMALKLNYLETSILGQQIQPTIIEGLPDFEKMSLQMMNTETKISLFNSIIRCLAGREVSVYFTDERVYIKREDSSSRSVNCFISCNSNQLTVTRTKNGNDIMHSFLIEKLLVAKVYHSQKKRYYFGIAYDTVKYRIKLEQEGPCARIHGALLSAIREKKSLKEKYHQNSTLKEKNDQLSYVNWDETGQERLFAQEKQYLCFLLNKIQEADMQGSYGFQLIKNIEHGKIMANRQKNAVKVLIFLQKCTIEGLVESYIDLGAWNINVDSFKIIKRIRQNTFIAHLRLKKRGFFTGAREGIITINYLKDCSCLHDGKNQGKQQNRHYLMFSSGSLEGQYLEKGAVPMEFHQIIQFSEIEGRPGVVFINLMSHIDFNVYQYLQSSVDLNIQFVQDLPSIGVVARERQMMKKGKSDIFEFNICVCDRRRKKMLFLSPELDKNFGRVSQISDMGYINQFNEEQAFAKQFSLVEIQKIIADNNALKVVDNILVLVNKKLYEKYYLRQKFNLKPCQKAYIDSEFHLKERPNFLGLGKSWKFTKSNQFVFIDQEELKLQKGILKMIVKQITSNIMAGKSIMNMALPVQIFDDYTALESLAWVFGFVPIFMNKALKVKEISEQIKYICLAFMFVYACSPKVGKPFNPILGETLQSSIGGILLYMEQVSHHPPVSSFLLKGEKFEASGAFDMQVDVGLNSAHMKTSTPVKIKIYQSKAEYIIKWPELNMGGVMFGDRTLKTLGKSYVLQKNSGTYLQLSAGKDKKKLYQSKTKLRDDDLVGGVFKITRQAVDRLLAIDKKKTIEGIKPEEAVEKYSQITGKWYGDLSFDGVCYKSIEKGPFPIQLQRPTVLLPSDCTFRLDVVYRRWRNFRKSNQQKEILENIQRGDRKLRQKYHPQK